MHMYSKKKMQEAINAYLQEIKTKYYSGHAVEHAYRPALQRMIETFDDTEAINDPARSEHGAPDFIFLKKTNPTIIKGYAEAKDIGKKLDKVEAEEQMKRYAGYTNLFLTDYLEFRFMKNGDKYETIRIGELKNNQLVLHPENGERLTRELQEFFSLAPEKITNGRRLAIIMGAKARRIRDNVRQYLLDEEESVGDLLKIYQMMRHMLVHDLSTDKFADMYAQTLVYGLFVARYRDSSPESFSRAEARDLVPKSNPFLREFFDHIAGTGFDTRLAKIVEELCEIFQISDVMGIVHKHLRMHGDTAEVKDPIIHFYEDFLKAYDSEQRAQMGAFYTPIPVVKFIIRGIDKILKEDLNIPEGLASRDMTKYEVDVGQDMRTDFRHKLSTVQTLTVPKVQILDPAVGTATFLNEVIKYIHEGFGGQGGRWPSYVRDNLTRRLYGFELMMAPYTIAHLKLGMTLKELGLEKDADRLNIFLTNTLEEGVSVPQDLFSFGLAGAVTEESRMAATIKSEKPVMVVMGNPPYFGESNNSTKFANSLVEKYKYEPGSKEKLKESNSKWINDDYIKFIAFAEDLISKNGSGVVGMITNHGYLDGPIFRGMRWHLMKTFDKIYILDLHGSLKRRETAANGSKDENVFDIETGVAIMLCVKVEEKKQGNLAEVYRADILGTRKEKFSFLSEDPTWRKLNIAGSLYSFRGVNPLELKSFEEGVSLKDLFPLHSTGVLTKNDRIAITFDKNAMWKHVSDFKEKEEPILRSDYGLKKDSRDWVLARAIDDVRRNYGTEHIAEIVYRPFDRRFTYYTGVSRGFMAYSQWKVMSNLYKRPENVALISGRQGQAVGGNEWNLAFITNEITDLNIFARGGGTVFPLYRYFDSGERELNLNPTALSRLTINVSVEIRGEEIMDYVYATLYSPSYRKQWGAYLADQFARIPIIPGNSEYRRRSNLGAQLRRIHLFEHLDSSNSNVTYPEQGTDVVDVCKYDAAKERVYINSVQYFGGVGSATWQFFIGGNQPAQKWLKDRKGLALSDNDLTHYQSIITALDETRRVMDEIG